MVSRPILTPNSFARALNDLKKGSERDRRFTEYMVRTRTRKKKVYFCPQIEKLRIHQVVEQMLCQL